MAFSAKISDQLSQAGLDAKYWTGILESKLNITLPQQIQYLDESHLPVLKGFVRQEWEEKALRKFLGISNEPQSNEANDAKSEIDVKLRETGLDGEYWADVLNRKLGVTRMEQIANLQAEHLKTLKDAVRHDWEEKALRKFFGISEEDYEASVDKLQKQDKQRLEEAKNLLGDVAELRQKGVNHTDEMVKSKLDQLRQLMNVADEQWIKEYDDESFDEMINKMKSDLKDLGKLVEDRPVNNASEILENASAGLALRGVLVGKSFSDDSVKRIVLSTPADVKLMNPVMLQVDDVVHFSTKAQSDYFHHSLDTMGYSLAATVKGGRWGFQFEADFSKRCEGEDETHSESHMQTKFESRVIYSVVPTAACELNPYSLTLSKEALGELKKIEKLLVGNANQGVVDNSCEEFLNSFGSHINAGVLHFGGVNKFVATYTSETKSKSDKTKSMVRDALSAYASAGYSGLGFSVGGSVSADRMKTNDNFTANYEKSEQAKTCLHTTRNGGPQEVSSLSLWKMGLVTCNSTWALIDRGKTLSRNFVGIWELIPNHEGEFEQPFELASSLMTVWERMSGYRGTKDKERIHIKALDTMDLLVRKISTWNSNPALHERCTEYLQEVLKTAEQVEALTGTKKYWEEKLCTEETIANFLEKIVELEGKIASNEISMIQFLIRMLVTPAGFREFRGKKTIMKWARMENDGEEAPSVLASAGIKTIPDLITNVKERFVPILQIEHAKNIQENVQVSDSINTGATVDMALCVSQLLKDLQSSGASHEVFFLRVSLLPLHYHWPSMTFETLLTMVKIQDFVQSIDKLWKEFHEQKTNGIIRLEAFLIHMSLMYGHFDEGNEASEQEFSEITKDLRHVISPQLNNVLNKYATHSPFNWFEMKRVTGELAKGNMSITEDQKVDMGDLKQVLRSQGRRMQKEQTVKTFPLGVTAQGAFADILKTLGLEEYYPSKISLLDAMVIKMADGHPKLVDLPWMFIHKILMIDFHARDHLLSVLKESGAGDTAACGDDFGLDDFLLEPPSSSNCEDNLSHLNTLDVLVAIFTCCDNFLRQKIANKLFVCKLAIPFLYPLGSEGNIVMSLWAFRTIIVQWHTKHKEATETPVTNSSLPLVTFVRLGRPSLSKSKLINSILRDDSHDTFFNHDCNNGHVARRLTDGLVECSWFITSGKDNEHLPATSMILNLRGDASVLNKQMQILLEISSVVFVMVTAEDLARDPHTSTCQEILQAGVKVILFLISGNSNQNIQDLNMERQACVAAVGKESLKGVRIISSSNRQGVQKNVSGLKTEARRQLSEAIAQCPVGMMMEECAQLAEKRGIIVDEYADEACLEGKVLAEKVVNHMKGKNIVDCKRVLLPLQGAEWIEYCTLLKKQHRASGKGSHMSSAYHADKLRQKMDRLRETQVKICCTKLTPFIKEFMSGLQSDSNDQDVVLYFLKWLNMFLDEISRANLPGLRRRYHTLWNEFQLAKKTHEKAKMHKLKSQVDDAEIKLAGASLGLENLFREVGQIYEAVKGSGKVGKDTRMALEYLPEIAAKLLMKGIPLELIDGDASSVPISWVSAVLSKLGEIIGEKRLFVLSVLGIQSSGKSTLLNTMFGLQFAVSAGRCTRGAYMQLIPVDDHAKLPFDYVIVVDTEGLRAPELGQLKYEHDNELATLVIGLGDVTLLNIKGENTAEMKDILQIAVHAFLRMNLVSRHIKDHRTCIFVHQNVPAGNAEELMMYGCQKLQEGLDVMAREAAHSENIANIHSFSEIINFDVQKNVWYFSDLWQGNPPMAPANPGYSEKVDAVRLSLLAEITKSQKTFLTTSDFSIRLADLWNGVLVDDFVFSFRNSLEVKAYNNLQSTYYTLEWKLQNELRTWLQKAEIKLKMCETVDDLENCFQLIVINLSDVLASKAEEIKTSLKNYFENSNLQDIIIQWQQSKLNQLNFAIEQQQNEGKTELLSVKEARRVEILQTQKWSKHEIHIMNKAAELSEKLKGKEVTDVELEQRFDSMWGTMVHELATKSADKEHKMDLLMEQILRNRFHAHGNILRSELERHPLNVPPEHTSLEDSITLDDVMKNHISLKRNLWESMKKLVGVNNPELQARRKTVLITGGILQKVSSYFKDLSNLDTPVKFQKSHATDVIQILVETINAYNKNAHMSEEYTFTILPEYVVKLAVHVSRHCVQVFTLMQFEYNKKHGVKAKLADYKKTAWSLFKNMVKQSTEEVMAGDLLCTEVKGIIEKAVKKEIPRKCVDEVLRDFQMTKYYLIVKMMDDLASKGNFKEYESYINNAKEFTLKWITQYTNEKMFCKQDESGMSRYAEITTSHIGRIIRCIAKSVEHATSEVKGLRGLRMPLWIDKFCKRVSEEVAIPISTLKHVSAREVVDFLNLQRIILDQLDKSVKANLVEVFTNETEYTVIWDGVQPAQQILDKIWGCPEQCPFCKEPCADTTFDHYSKSGRSHLCVQHRPAGIGGGRWDSDNVIDGIRVRKDQLLHDICNYTIQRKNIVFNCRDCNFKCRDSGKCTTTGTNWVYHKYLECKTYLPSWDIAPDPTNNVSKYWMWFMMIYQSQLKDLYQAQLPDIPGSWSSITKDDALADLRKIHN